MDSPRADGRGHHALTAQLDAWDLQSDAPRFADTTAWMPTMSPEQTVARGLTPTVCFPHGNLAPEGSVIKSTAIDPSAGRWACTG